MSLSWNEVRDRAVRFARDWKGEGSEKAERQTFWNEFFNVFGLSRRAVASFEEPVRNLAGNFGFIDLFWRGTLLVEHKSKGQNLDRAQAQAFDYMQSLVNDGRADELPRYLILCDFARIALFDLEPDDQRDLPLFDRVCFNRVEFPLHELHKHVREFAFIKGEQAVRLDPQDPANEKAYQVMADLHDALAHGGLTGHELERFLVRVLFCLFAEDTSIFEPNAFLSFLEHRTNPDGSDLGARLNQLFEVLNTPGDRRSSRLDEELAEFPYVNGRLFEERLGFADFNSDMRNALIGCCRFQWAKISPAVFGSLFQGVMEDRERRQQGAHYTSERDIMKVVRSLFLDGLQQEFEAIVGRRALPHPNPLPLGEGTAAGASSGTTAQATLSASAGRSPARTASPPLPAGEGRGEGGRGEKPAPRLTRHQREKLQAFHARLGTLRFLDPACGCGNFLILTYRELRLLELQVLKELFRGEQTLKLDLKAFCRVDVDQFYGLEISEWPSLIAEVAMWLLDHQMNLLVSETFGERLVRLPLTKSPQIRCTNALRTDWKQFLPPAECSYVLGNPPFVGKKEQNAQQKADMEVVWGDVKGTGILDFVTCWYRKAAEYIQSTHIRCAFVSTNSISQGEQVGVLWSELFNRWHLKIHFAHRTFSWMSEARGKAHVHVVIIGFGAFDRSPKHLYEYDRPDGAATVATVTNINPYLLEGADTTVRTRTTPLNGAPAIFYGSMMIDKDRQHGYEAGLILSAEHRAALLSECPALAPFIRRLYGGDEFLNNTERWCLWLVDAPPELLDQSPLLRARIRGVKAFREGSSRPQTKELALTPTLFGEIRQPATKYLLVPKVSAHTRRYLPIGFLAPDNIASGSTLIVPGATLFHFGVLSSAMHNGWMRCVAGRMKSDYQYSNNIVYNNFPWPVNVTYKARDAVDAAAQAVLDARARFPNLTLAKLYNPLDTPPALTKAHTALDRAVDRCYRKEPFPSDRARVEHLFALYEQLTAPLIPAATKPRRISRKQPSSATAPAPYPAQPPLDATRHFHVMEDPVPYRTRPPNSGE